MSRFKKEQLKQVISNLERIEEDQQESWIAVGILEMMYDDDCGYLQQYFELPRYCRNFDDLWLKLHDHLARNGSL